MSLLAPPAAPINTYPLSEPSTITNRTASHGRPVLEKGHGLKDWIRLCRRSTDLSGTNGHILRVTTDELAKHCTEEDAWTAINGRVYNITPYLPFHPGSASELMRGAGKDCTDLFNQYHSYVQFDRFLSKCFVGNLIREGTKGRRLSSPACLPVPGLRPHLPTLPPIPPPVTTSAAENNSDSESEPSTNTNRTASHGRPVLETGHGLKDWIRLCQRSTDLSGTNGHMLRVTADELAKHCTEEDAWTAINGRVYNITPYLPFHPGSASELMRGAGKDCTDLFNQYHPYLQFDRFLSNCFVGNLIHEGPQSRKVSSPAYLYIPGLQPHLPKLSPSPPPVTTTAEKIAENNSGNRWCVRKNSYHEPVLEEVEDSTSCTPSTDTPDSGIIQAVPDSLPGISISVEEPTEGSTAVSCPRYEWYQTNSTVVVAFYTRFKGLKSTNLQVDMDRGMGFTASLFLGEHVHTLSWQLEREVERTAVAVRGTTVELTMYKKERGLHWRQLSVVSEDSTTAVNKREPVYREGTLVSVEEVTHNTKLFTFRLPPGLYMNVPVGHHVKLCGHLEGEEIARSYTPISSLNPAPCPRGAVQCDTLQLMVKLYSDGKMSRVLSALTEGESLLIGEPEGEFDWESVRAKKICLIAAGSGFTPMVKITSAALGRSEETEVTLIFANRSERDILWQAELERLQDTFSTRFQVVHTLSNPSPSWTGLRGRITSPLLQEYLPQPGDCCRGDLLVCVCGMYQFTVAVTQALKGLGYSEEDIHVFV